jgi:prepilin-type processing-associated H-X9-DG protein
LIELLVVVAIIALLISILLPSLSKAKELAKAAVCLGHVRQAAVAAHTYAGEFEGVIPQGRSWGSPGVGAGNWSLYWTTFLKMAGNDVIGQGLRCPNVASGSYAGITGDRRDNQPRTKGEFLTHPFGSNPSLFTFQGINTAEMIDTPNYAMFADSAQVNSAGYPYLGIPVKQGGGAFSAAGAYNSGGQRHHVWLAHLERANAAFGDGHGEMLGLDGLREVGNYNSQAGHGITSWWDGLGNVVNAY